MNMNETNVNVEKTEKNNNNLVDFNAFIFDDDSNKY